MALASLVWPDFFGYFMIVLWYIWLALADQWTKKPEVVIAIVAVIVSTITVIVTTYYQKRNADTHETNSKYQRLIEVYGINNEVDNRAYQIYRKLYYKDKIRISDKGKTYTAKYVEELKGKQFDNIFSDPDVLNSEEVDSMSIQKDVETVRATMDHIGALFNNKLIPEEALMKALWGVVIYCWDALEQHINIERDVRRTLDYMDNFEKFYLSVEHYVKATNKVRVRLEDTDTSIIWNNP